MKCIIHTSACVILGPIPRRVGKGMVVSVKIEKIISTHIGKGMVIKMKITLNGKGVTAEQGVTITELLKQGYTEMLEYITVQVNDDILPKELYDSYPVEDGDSIEILFYMGGGSGPVSEKLAHAFISKWKNR